MEEWMQRNGLKLVLAAFAFVGFIATLDIYARVAFQRIEVERIRAETNKVKAEEGLKLKFGITKEK